MGYLERFKFLIMKWNKELVSELDRIQQDIMSMPDPSNLINNEIAIKNQLNQVMRNEETY